ncbi:hypothetical protein N657DRAFT_648282 [Parathielavia appendiculata]|uniref:Uncharacterized protein n=1 Tax=Parathielavia appendiculata TaxID=2587402 RepID=A0AAN6Z115_9PEZI|nr:hypothetical protein N657DRAFT_648282 [Parathielavia appendiculata]
MLGGIVRIFSVQPRCGRVGFSCWLLSFLIGVLEFLALTNSIEALTHRKWGASHRPVLVGPMASAIRRKLLAMGLLRDFPALRSVRRIRTLPYAGMSNSNSQ